MIIYFWLLLVFVLGAVVGSFCNVAIARLPLEKSLLWPGSRCGQCFQPIRWYDNLPLISYWWLRGRCRMCAAPFSMRYFWVELVTALGFVALFYLEMMVNVHRWPNLNGLAQFGFFPWQWWAGYGFHAILFSFFMVASVTDLEGREIPFSLTFTGALIGLAGAVLMPWPWPQNPAQALPNSNLPPNPVLPGMNPWQVGLIGQGVFPWPVWGPLPGWLPAASWQLGLATGLAGLLVGTFMLRAIGFLFSRGIGREAMGLGDADLMMMAGCFLGWQPVVVGFFVSIGPALVFGLVQLFIHKDNELPFGPSLAAGVLITMLGWHWIGKYLQFILFWDIALVILATFAGLFMLGASYLMRRKGPEKAEQTP